jgi:type IV pilus assembly protein PilO
MALKLDSKNVPKGLKIVLAFLPSVIIAIIVLLAFVSPMTKEFKQIKKDIAKQEEDIKKYQALVDKLEILKVENEALKKKLDKLSEYLPEEKEVSSLLKQISDVAFTSDVDIISWKPEARKAHSSGIVEEIPFSVTMSGDYHSFGDFFSNLSQLNRIVNLSDIKIAVEKSRGKKMSLNIGFKAVTFTAVKEGSTPVKGTKAVAGKGKAK